MYTNCESCGRKFGDNEDPCRIDAWDRAKRLNERYYLDVCRSCMNKFEEYFNVRKKQPRIRKTKKQIESLWSSE